MVSRRAGFGKEPLQPAQNECLLHRPIALTLRVSVNIDIRGQGGSPTLTRSPRERNDDLVEARFSFSLGRRTAARARQGSSLELRGPPLRLRGDARAAADRTDGLFVNHCCCLQ